MTLPAFSIARPIARGIAHPIAAHEGVGGDPILAAFADGTDGFYFDFSKTDRLFQDLAGATLADGAGENIALALDAHTLDGRGPVNKLIYTQQFDNATWTKANATSVTPTVSANAAMAPDGTMTADEVAFGAIDAVEDASVIRQSLTLGSSVKTGSVYLKAKTAGDVGKSLFLYFNASGSRVDQVGHVLTADWVRVSTTGLTATGNSLFSVATLGSSLGGANQDACAAYMWGAQVEEGAAASAYQQNGASVGGPGNHGLQATTAAQPKWQTGGLARFDGSDDCLPTPLVPGSAMTLMAKCAFSVNNSKVIMGCQDASSGRCQLIFSSLQSLSAGVGNHDSATIFASTDISNSTHVVALTFNGSTVKLYIDGVEEYSGAQSGSPSASVPITVGARNVAGTNGVFFDKDIYHALAIKKALTAAEIAAITNQWGTS